MELLNDWVSGEIYGSEEDLKDFVVDLQEPYSRPYRIQFDENAGYPKYWILPLSNFCCPFCQKKDSLRTHPLRINKDDTVLSKFFVLTVTFKNQISFWHIYFMIVNF